MTAIFQTWTAGHLAEIVGGIVLGDAAARAHGLYNDTRKLPAGGAFVALRADRDGHTYLEAARRAGATLLLAERGRAASSGQLSQAVQGQAAHGRAVQGWALIEVEDTFVALERLASAIWREHRRLCPQRVGVGITGSNGKTTTKELIAALLRTAHSATFATKGNLNNHIGLPMTLCELRAEHTHVVLEMGASQLGDIAQLIAIAPVDRALLTNVSGAHLGGFGSLEALEGEKGNIFRGRPAPELAVVPRQLCDRVPDTGFVGAVRSFDVEEVAGEAVVGEEAEHREGASVCVRRYTPSFPGGRFTLELDGTLGPAAFEVELSLPGRHNALNLAAAVATVWDLLPEASRVAEIQRVAKEFRPPKDRSTWLRGEADVWILDDAYNANPASMEAALEVLTERPGRRWAVLGDMLELGEGSEAAHEAIGRRAAHQSRCERIFAVGQYADAIVRGAGAERAEAFGTAQDCAVRVRSQIGEGGAANLTVLVKGSRGVGLEAVVAALAPAAGAEGRR